jgi:hypothetical protein
MEKSKESLNNNVSEAKKEQDWKVLNVGIQMNEGQDLG